MRVPSDQPEGSLSAADADRVFVELYPHLKRLAAVWLADEASTHTLQPTALVHEAYLKLSDYEGLRINGQPIAREHYFAIAAKAMRQVLVDHARKRLALKRGGPDARRITLSAVGDHTQSPLDVLSLHDVLEKLARLNAQHAQIVELRFFGGLALDDIAQLLHIAPRTLTAQWAAIRAWLHVELSRGPSSTDSLA